MNNRGISPVIATVIIVAVAIAIAIAVAFWMTGIVGLFTGFEEVQVLAAYNEPNPGSTCTDCQSGWFNISLTVKNTGTTTATIDNVFVNGKPIDNSREIVDVDGSQIDFKNGDTISLNPGDQKVIWVVLDGNVYKHGVSVEIKIHTASGKEYPKLIVLP